MVALDIVGLYATLLEPIIETEKASDIEVKLARLVLTVIGEENVRVKFPFSFKVTLSIERD